MSPNSRYLYASATDSLFQLDLQAPDIQESLTFIEAYDGSLFRITACSTCSNWRRTARSTSGNRQPPAPAHHPPTRQRRIRTCDFEQHNNIPVAVL
ncbi:MAG: hypothetical protein H6560_06025 [Lewinellaceae bacterium]|nr:hypothetical protein [Lewinellaceae bacterium]